MTTNINPKEFIKAQNDAKEAIIDAHFKGSIEYMDNIPYYNSTNNKDLSLAIEKLIDFNVFDMMSILILCY
jgi:trehalose-6-phosphate synthase